MKVKDVMTADSLKYCTLETSLHTVAKTMKENNHGALPVLNKENRVVGIITDRDIALSLASKKESKIADLKVDDVMTEHTVHTVKTEDPIDKALTEMRKHKVGRLPVTDTNGALKGIITLNSLLSHSLEKKEGISNVASTEENLTKTLQSLFERNKTKQTKDLHVNLESHTF